MEKEKSFLARLRKRGQITVPPDYIEALGVKEGDLLDVNIKLEKRGRHEKSKE